MVVVNTNISALRSSEAMRQTENAMGDAMERLSTGSRINSASDDAAGSAIASKMEAQTRSLGVAIRNANDAISLTQTAEGALGEVEEILQRMRELSVQAGNSTLNTSDRAQIQLELDALAAEVDTISSSTNFNSVNLFDGTNSSVSMQIGIDASDSLAIALQKTDTSTLGIGSSSSVKVLTSERVSAITAGTDFAINDIKINGENAFAAALDTEALAHNNGTVDAEAALSANSDHAGAIASIINTNSSVHGAVATAHNEVVATSSAYIATGTITVNGVTIQNLSKQDFVDEVNNGAIGATASIDSSDRIVFSNDDGGTIVLGGANITNIGHAAASYAGFVSITNADGSDVSIEAGNVANGYGANATAAPGTVGDMQAIGFNDVVGSTITSAAVTTTALTAAMNVEINGVLIGASDDDSAAAKAAAINAANAGVTATARTEVRIDVDLVAGAGDADDAAIGGITVDLDDASIQDLSDVVDAINTAMTGNNDIVASSNSDGELVLVSESGQNIIFDDGSEDGDLFTAAAGDDGVANASLAAGVGTAFGILTLTSDDGSQITLSDGEGPTHTGLDTLGLQAQSEKVDTTTSGLDVGSVANATAAITAIDTAIETVSSFRAGFGATENRLDKAINNLTTYKVNLEAAKGRIEDADFASETAALTKSQILNQAATSMLAQANASKQNLLALLQ